MDDPRPSVAASPARGNGKRPVCNADDALLRPARLRITLGLVTALMLLTTACVDTAMRVAPFRNRPDSADAGALGGPFTGRVVDATTHTPIAGALVYAAWSFERGAGLPTPAGVHEFVGSTDAAGNYKVPSLAATPNHTHLADFTLLIYKRGFIAYRSDRRFNDLGPRMDFAQRDNQVLLERWRAELSHARHLRFVGGGSTIAALTSWELADASAELDGKRPQGEDIRPGRGEGPYIVAAQLLTDVDIKERTKFDGAFETGPLSDEPDTATYSSQHFKALGRPESFDVALRVWHDNPGKAQERYDELLNLPGATIVEKDELASRSFQATENNIHGIGFLDGPRGVVVLLTCGNGQCAKVEDALFLGTLIYNRVKQALPAPVAPGVAPQIPSSPPPGGGKP
jgi:hypothetical protein